MAQAKPTYPPPSWKPAFAMLTVLTVVSLLINLFLLGTLLSLRRKATPLLEAAAGLGRTLQQATEEPLSFEFPIQQRFPFRMELPVQHTIEVNVDSTIPVDTGFLLEVTLPGVGQISEFIPVHLEIPLSVQAPIEISATVPISMAVPISMTFPVTIDLQNLPIAEDLAQLAEALQEIAPPTEEPQ